MPKEKVSKWWYSFQFWVNYSFKQWNREKTNSTLPVWNGIDSWTLYIMHPQNTKWLWQIHLQAELLQSTWLLDTFILQQLHTQAIQLGSGNHLEVGLKLTWRI